ncbi:MAG TPA: DUF3153 domain-containing protein [Coleofasciculaceae cyanobacterium]
MSRTLPRAKTIAHILVKFRLLWLILIAFFLLSGCVRSDVDIRFNDANHGQLVQRLQLSQPATSLESAVVDAWLERLEHQAIALGGRLQRQQKQQTSVQTLKLTIPFFNSKDLETKFNQLLQAELQPSGSRSRRLPTLPPIISHLHMRSGNWILWQRMVLDYQLDLRSLDRLLSSQKTYAKLPLNPRDLLNLEFSLHAPDVKILNSSPAAVLRKHGQRLVWSPQPGEINQLKAVFWLPSPLGRGTALIVLFVLLGMWFKAHPPKAFTPS